MQDDLAHARAFRDDLRALKKQYPELTTPAAQARLEAYLDTAMEKEHRMPRSGDRMLGEDLSIVTFRIPSSALPLIEEHLVRMQQASRWVRLGKSDAQRDIFLRGLDSLEGLPAPGRPRQVEMELPVDPAATSAGGAIPPAPAYEARALTPDLEPEIAHEPARRTARRQPMPPEAAELEDMPLTMEPPAVTEDSAAPEAPTEDVRPRRGRPARPTAAVAATSQATPKRTTRTTKGR